MMFLLNLILTCPDDEIEAIEGTKGGMLSLVEFKPYLTVGGMNAFCSVDGAFGLSVLMCKKN